MRNRKPDVVPVSPDISNMIPCKLTGKPFWDIYLYKNPPLWKAYIDAVRYFGFDGWLSDDKDDDAAEGGGFIFSTGDQCGRDTPEENIFKMIETAREYGKY